MDIRFLKKAGFLCSCLLVLSGCFPVKVKESNTYKLQASATKPLVKSPSYKTLYVSSPTSAAGFNSEDMRYVKVPYLLESFAYNQWVAKPEDMLAPILVHSLQTTNYFKAVIPNNFTGKANFRLDSEVLLLQQDFLQKPSHETFSLRVALIDVKRDKIIAARVFSVKEKAPYDTPYGGVIAANRALDKLLSQIRQFVVNQAKRA